MITFYFRVMTKINYLFPGPSRGIEVQVEIAKTQNWTKIRNYFPFLREPTGSIRCQNCHFSSGLMGACQLISRLELRSACDWLKRRIIREPLRWPIRVRIHHLFVLNYWVRQEIKLNLKVHPFRRQRTVKGEETKSRLHLFFPLPPVVVGVSLICRPLNEFVGLSNQKTSPGTREPIINYFHRFCLCSHFLCWWWRVIAL